MWCCGSRDDAMEERNLEDSWPRAMLEMVFSYCDDETAPDFCRAAGPTFKVIVSQKLKDEEDLFKRRRERIIDVLVRILKDESSIDIEQQRHLFTPDGIEGIESYLHRMRRCNLSVDRREALASAVLRMLNVRSVFVFPVLRMNCAFDFLSGLHFSKCEAILHQSQYFDLTIKYFLLIRRRAAIDGFDPPTSVLSELYRYERCYNLSNVGIFNETKVIE